MALQNLAQGPSCRSRQIRGSALERVELKEGLAISHERTEEVLALDGALARIWLFNEVHAPRN
jgi:hypothetical protein